MANELITVRGMVSVSAPPKKGTAIAWTIAVVLLAIGIVGGLCVGNWYMLVGFIPLSFAINAAKKASSTKEVREVTILLSCVSALLTIRINQSRFVQGVYYDQVYKTQTSDIDSIAISETGDVRVRTNCLESYYEKDNQPFETHSVNYAEINFRVAKDVESSLRAFFLSNELSLRP